MATSLQRVALVTGASSGIGQAVAVAVARPGTAVTLVGRRRARLEETGRQVCHAGGESLVAPADLRREADVIRAFEESQRRWGRLDILVNCAAVGLPATLHDGDVEKWREMVEVNILGAALATREALKWFDPNAGGHVVNIGSTSGHRVPEDGCFYSITKFALRALNEVLRRELRARRSPTRASCISPGRTTTELFGNQPSQSNPSGPRVSLTDELTPGDVARLVVQLVNLPPHVEVGDLIVRARDSVR